MRIWFRPSKKDMHDTINFLYRELDHEKSRTESFKQQCIYLQEENARLERELERPIVKYVEKEY